MRRRSASAKGPEEGSGLLPVFPRQTPRDPSPGFSAVNAYWDGDQSVVVVSRDEAGCRRQRKVDAEYSCFLRAAEVTEKVERDLRSSRHVKGMRLEGDYWRVRWRDREALKKATSRPKFPGPDGERLSYFDRVGVEPLEADVHPVRRWLTDNDVAVQRPRRCYLDLETDSRVSFADKEEMRILTWAVVAHDGGQSWSGVLEEDTDLAERRLLQELWQVLEQFDQVCAWNGDGFDFPVLRARTRFRRITVSWHSWLWLDHLEWFKRCNMSASESGEEKTSYRLGVIATAVLGETKDDLDASHSYEYWAAGGEERAKLSRYNGRDTDLLRSIELKTGYIDLLQTLCESTHSFADSRGSNGTNYVEGFLLRLARGRGVHFKTIWEPANSTRFEGALVIEPTRLGVLRDIHVADFASLYPSIIQTWNMSPETLLEMKTRGKLTGPGYRDQEWRRQRPPDSCEHPTLGWCFSTATTGLLAEAVTELKRLRKYWSDLKATLPPGTSEWKDADRRSAAFKIAANTFYGVIGSIFSRFFVRDVAESVTQSGAWLLRLTAAEAERWGMAVVYGDSVTGDRTVVVCDPRGHVLMLPIVDLWNEGEHLRVGGHEYALPVGWQALTELGWRPLTAVMRHRAGKETYRLTTKHGQTQVTADHGIMVDGEEMGPVAFVAGGRRFTTVAPHAPSPAEVIDLFDYVGGFEQVTQYKGHRRVRCLIADGESIFLDGWGDYGKVSFRRFYRRGSPEFASLLRLVAAYVGDGSATIAGCGSVRSLLSFCKANRQLMDQLALDLGCLLRGAEVFGPYWSDTVYVVRSGTTLAACIFAALCGQGCLHKRLPPFAFELDAEAAEILVYGLERGDGSVDQSGQLEYTSTSQELTAGVSYLLAQHGMDHSFSFRQGKGAWKLRTRDRESSRYSIKVERFDPDGGYVYDLTVDGAHTFVDGVGRVLLHNTDSVFVERATEAQFSSFVKHCNEELYPKALAELGCPINEIKLAYEKQFDVLVLVSAKRYAGSFVHYKGSRATADSKPEIKGLEYKRGDTTRLARQMQLEVIEALLAGKFIEPQLFVELAERWLERVVRGDIELADVILSKRLSKAVGEYASKKKKDGTDAAQPPHVAVAKVMQARGENVSEGTRIDYVVVDASSSPLKAVPAADVQDVTGVDRHYAWEVLVWPPTQRVLEVCFPGQSADWRRLSQSRPPKVRARAKPVAAPDGGIIAAKPSRRRAPPPGQGSLW